MGPGTRTANLEGLGLSVGSGREQGARAQG